MRVFRDEYGKTLTQDELLLEFLHLDAKGETECKDIMEYIDSCTGKNGTMKEYEVPQYGDIVMLNTFADGDEELSDWYRGETLKVVCTDIRDWKFWVKGYAKPIPIEYSTLLLHGD